MLAPRTAHTWAVNPMLFVANAFSILVEQLISNRSYHWAATGRYRKRYRFEKSQKIPDI